jgi:hypothetical protein
MADMGIFAESKFSSFTEEVCTVETGFFFKKPNNKL